MEKIFNSLLKSSLFVISSLGIAGIVILLKKKLLKRSLVKDNILEQMKDTPLVLIKSLSDLTGCKIYVSYIADLGKM